MSQPGVLCSVLFPLSSLNSAYSCNFLIWLSFVLVKTVESRRKVLFSIIAGENIEILFANFPLVPMEKSDRNAK